MPRTLEGRAPALAIDDLRNFRLRGGGEGNAPRAARGPETAIEAMYASTSDPLLASTAHEMFDAVSTLQRLGVDDYSGENGAEYPRGPLGRSLQQIAQLI